MLPSHFLIRFQEEELEGIYLGTYANTLEYKYLPKRK